MTENIQQDNLLILIRITLQASEMKLINPQWSEILRLAREQALSGFVAQAAINYGADNSEEFRTDLLMQINHSVRLRHAQRKLHQILSENSIAYAIIKGSAVEIYYPDNVVRTMGDVDFLVRKEELRRAYDVLIEAGFSDRDSKLSGFPSKKIPRHIGLVYNGIEFELHQFFVSPEMLPAEGISKTESELLTEEFNFLLEEKLNQTVACYNNDDPGLIDFCRFPDMINGLILIQHINQHMKEGLGLRQIIDWMMFVEACAGEDWWNDFEDLLKKFNLSKIAYYSTEFCRIYLGLDDGILKDMDVSKELTEEVCEKLKIKLFSDGNFGHRDGTISRNMRNATNGKRGIGEYFKRLQKGGISRWDAARKYEILRPFAWLYQLCRVLPPLLKRENAIKSIKQDIKEADKDRELYKYLGMM